MAISPSNSFRNASDIKVLNTIKQAKHYPIEMVAEATEVAKERGLMTKNAVNNQLQIPTVKEAVKQELQNGQSEILVINNLKSKGYSQSQAEDIVLQAQSERLYGTSARPSGRNYNIPESSSFSPWTILLIVYIIFRLVRCAVVMGQ